MNKFFFLLALILVIFTAIFVFYKKRNNIVEENSNVKISNEIIPSSDSNVSSDSVPVNELQKNIFQLPLDRAGERVTKKKFGQFITPQNSPVQPERFSGYHTGTDFEIFPEELNANVPVRAICDGKIVQKRYASGYGGVLIESCEFDNQPVSAELRRGEPITVIYGHLKLASVTKEFGDNLIKSEVIGILGKAFSAETNGERKHLHLAVHKGSGIDIRGYVQKESELSGWVDPCSFQSVCQ